LAEAEKIRIAPKGFYVSGGDQDLQSLVFRGIREGARLLWIDTRLKPYLHAQGLPSEEFTSRNRLGLPAGD